MSGYMFGGKPDGSAGGFESSSCLIESKGLLFSSLIISESLDFDGVVGEMTASKTGDCGLDAVAATFGSGGCFGWVFAGVGFEGPGDLSRASPTVRAYAKSATFGVKSKNFVYSGW